MAAEELLETPEEKAYFDSRGETDEATDTTPDTKAAPPVQQGDNQPAGGDADEADEQVSGEEIAGKAADKLDKTVPIHALHEARAQLKEQREQMAQLQQRLGQFESLRNELIQYRQSQQQAQQQQSDAEAFEEDPIGYLRRQNEQIMRSMNAKDQATTEQTQAVNAMNAFLTEVDRQKQVFMQDHPDYLEAYNFIQQQRMADYDIIGITDMDRKQQQLGTEAMQLSYYALENGMNPAELVYKMAKHRGYTPKGQQKPPANLQEQVNKLNSGQQAAQSLSGMASGPEDQPLNLSNVAEMSDDDFDKLWAEYAAAERKH